MMTSKKYLIYLQTYKTMSSYCLMCNKIQKAKTQEVEKIKSRKKVKPVLLSSSLVCGSEKIKIYQKTRNRMFAKYDL